MNAASRNRFLDQTRATAEALKSGTIQIGDDDYVAAVFHSSVTVDNDRGAEAEIRTLVAQVGKDLLPHAPDSGVMMTHVETGETFEIYEVGGIDGPKWIIRGASFPRRAA